MANAQREIEEDDSDNKIEISFYLPINQNQFPGLMDQLNAALDQANLRNLKLVSSDYWHPYQNGIRQGRIGIYFTAPHFASWLIHKHKFDPILRLSGKSQYVIAARRSDSHIFEVNDLADKTVCTNATMSLSFLLVRQSMTQSVLSAETQRVQDVSKEMQKNNSSCDAFSLSEHLFLEFSVTDPFKYIRLQQSKLFSNYAYLVHPEVPLETKVALRKFLISKKTSKLLRPMYRLFSAEPSIIRGKLDNYPKSQMESLKAYWGADKLKAP